MVKRGTEPRAAKRARAAESERRARMFVHAHLAWLAGFAEVTDGGLRWHRLDGTAPFVVDGALVARARRAQRTLVSDHADALANVVGEVRHWGAAVDGALGAIAQALRTGGAPETPVSLLPPRARRMRASVAGAYPELAAVVEAATMAMLARPVDLVQTLAWIEANGEALSGLARAEPGPRGVLACLRLARFADEAGAAAVVPLVALACVDAPQPEVAVAMARAIAQRLRSSSSGRSVPPRTTTATIVDWIARLAGVDPAARERVFAALDVVDLVSPLEALRSWWKRALPVLQRAQAVADGATLDIEYVRANLDAVDALLKHSPPVFDVVDAIATVEQAAAPAFAPAFPSLVRLLAVVPTRLGSLARLRLLDELRDDAAIAGDAKMAWLWDALAAEIPPHGA